MTGISFQRFVIVISTDVLRRTRRDIAENLAKRDLPGSQKNNEAVAQLAETHLMTRIANGEKAGEIQRCFSGKSFGKQTGAYPKRLTGEFVRE